MRADATSAGSPRRLALWAGVAIALTALNLRTAVTGFSPLLAMIGADLGYGLGTAALLGTLPAAAFAVFGFVAPVITRAFGLERTAAVALALTTASLAVRAMAPSPIVLVISTALALGGVGAANVVLVPLVKAWFADRLALWTSGYLILMQSGQLIAPLLAVPVATAAGWRLSVGIWAIPAAIAALVWLVLTIRLPAAHHAAAPTARVAMSRMLRSPTAWGLLVLFATVSAANYAIVTWLPMVLTDAGGDAALGGAMIGLYAAWGVVAAFVVPQLATRLGNPVVVVAVCAVFLAAGCTGLMLAPLAGTAVWVCAIGLGQSTFPLCMALINLRTRSAASASSLSGFVQGIGYAIACLGPLGLGALREATGSWLVPLVALAATVVPSLVGGWFACRPRFVDDDAA